MEGSKSHLEGGKLKRGESQRKAKASGVSSLPAIEVVDDPEADTLYRGRKGQGEFCSGKQIQGLVRRFQEVDDGDDTGETDVQRYELGVGVASSGWSGGRKDDDQNDVVPADVVSFDQTHWSWFRDQKSYI